MPGQRQTLASSSSRRTAATRRRYNGRMGDHQLVEWLVYMALGLCALGLHSALTAVR